MITIKELIEHLKKFDENKEAKAWLQLKTSYIPLSIKLDDFVPSEGNRAYVIKVE